jgi:hypothetical protein
MHFSKKHLQHRRADTPAGAVGALFRMAADSLLVYFNGP